MKKNKFLAILIAMIMAISVLPTAALAEGEAAEIDGEKYDTLAAAIGEVSKNGTAATITLLTDVYLTEPVKVEAGQDIILDLNGKAITVSQTNGRSLYAIDNYGTFTLTDSSAEGNGFITARGVENYGTMYMRGGTINSCDSNGGGAAVWNEGTFEMTGGTLRFTGAATADNSAGSPFINAAVDATAKITGGTLESDYTALFVNTGKVTVENMTLSTKTDYWMAVKSYSGSELTMTNVTVNAEKGGCIEVAGGTAVLTNCTFTQTTTGDPTHNSSAVAVSTGGEVTVKGGTYTSSAFGAYVFNSGGTIYIEDGDFEAPTALKADTSTTDAPSEIVISGGGFDGDISIAGGAELTISGGSFSSVVDEAYCADGFVPATDENGKYTVKIDDSKIVKVTSADGAEKAYGSLEEALEKAQNGDTVTLLKDTTTSERSGISIDKDLTIDLNDCTVSGTGNQVFYIKNGTVEIKNGKIEGETMGIRCSGGTVTLTDVEITAEEVAVQMVGNVVVTVDKDSVVTSTGDVGIYLNGSQDGKAKLHVYGTVVGGEYYDEDEDTTIVCPAIESGISQNGADVSIYPDAEIQSDGEAIYYAAPGKLVIEGGTISGGITSLTVAEDVEDAQISISGGDFTGDITAPEGITGFISGGTFNKEVPGEYCAEGYHSVDIKTTTGTVYTVMKEEYDFQEITVIGPNGENELSAIMTKTEDGTVTVVSVQGSGIDEALMEPQSTDPNWSYQGWTFTASDGTSFGPVKKLTSELANWLTQKIQNGDTLTMDSKTPGTSGSGTGSHGSSSSSVTTYPVTVDSAKHGTVTTSQKNASRGTTVTITVKPDDGYELDSLTVTDKNGDRVKVTEGKNGKFTFTMPAGKVTVEAEFAQTQETPDQRFTDVPEGYWAEDEINWAADNGYMNGNTAATFNPEGSVTRQQLWMILARLSGQRPADFAEAKAWAMDNGVSDGTNPGNAVSRQQLVTILYRYAVMMGYKTTGAADLTQFPDHASVAAYATDAMSWSVANGIVGGTTAGTLNPTGTATRAQFAVILSRFCGKIVG